MYVASPCAPPPTLTGTGGAPVGSRAPKQKYRLFVLLFGKELPPEQGQQLACRRGRSSVGGPHVFSEMRRATAGKCLFWRARVAAGKRAAYVHLDCSQSIRWTVCVRGAIVRVRYVLSGSHVQTEDRVCRLQGFGSRPQINARQMSATAAFVLSGGGQCVV